MIRPSKKTPPTPKPTTDGSGSAGMGGVCNYNSPPITFLPFKAGNNINLDL
jgi:hypothetical protein